MGLQPLRSGQSLLSLDSDRSDGSSLTVRKPGKFRRSPGSVRQHFGLRGRLVCGSTKQQQIPLRIFDDESLGAPRLLFQCLVKCDACGLKLKKQ